MSLSNLKKHFNLGNNIAITSICSANSYVVKAAMLSKKNCNHSILIESTSNQVDQFGGYTGMTPKDFVDFVKAIAIEVEFPIENIIFGGDHLGPNVWQNESAESAMLKAEDQMRAYVKAGFRKIHLDTSFSLGGDDKSKQLSPAIITERAARLCEVSEETFNNTNELTIKPIYVIGTEVPIPGGAQEKEESIVPTKSEDLESTIQLSKESFYKLGLEEAWERVIAVVVQPGVEFSDSQVFNYDRINVAGIKNKINDYPNLVFEAHSTDYQSKIALREMVQDNFGILKVGPWLTFAMREAIFALADIESEIIDYSKSSNLKDELEKIMLDNPKYWEKHYHGTPEEIKLARAYSYSDRVRYYWADKKAVTLVEKLVNNLKEVEIPNTLISQYLPTQYYQIMEDQLEKNPENIIISKIIEVLNLYDLACGGSIEK